MSQAAVFAASTTWRLPFLLMHMPQHHRTTHWVTVEACRTCCTALPDAVMILIYHRRVYTKADAAARLDNHMQFSEHLSGSKV